MTTRQPSGAREVTREEADKIINATKAGQPPTVKVEETPPQPTEKAPPATPKDPLIALNPPVGVWCPTAENQTLHGYLVARGYDHGREQDFFVIELIEPCAHLEFQAGPAKKEAPPGTRVAVWSDPSNAFLVGLLPEWGEKDNPTGPKIAVAKKATELVITSYRASASTTGWDCLITGRRVADPKIAVPPMACLPDADPPEHRGDTRLERR